MKFMFQFFGINPNHYIGPYGTIFTTLDVVICAEVSRRIFATQKKHTIVNGAVLSNLSFRKPKSVNV